MMRKGPRALCVLITLLLPGCWLHGQQPSIPASQPGAAERLQVLSRTLAQTEGQMQQLEREIAELRTEMESLRRQLPSQNGTSSGAAAQPSPALEDLQEQQQLQQAEIATQDQSKVESFSKLPVRVSGLVLLNGFANTRGVDDAAAPTIAEAGSGATGLSLRQTLFALAVQGPHLWGASTAADVSADFFGSAAQGGYQNQGGILRLRTAHGSMDWEHTEAFVALDRPIFSPYSPSSLLETAVPPLAWSGNLWNWIPQLGVRHDFAMTSTHALRVQTALLDVPDAPMFQSTAPSISSGSVSLAENSRQPSGASRIALVGSPNSRAVTAGVGGYFSPHRDAGGGRFNAWAVTGDLRIPLPARLQLTGSAYRGQALGGLGGGAYKDYTYLRAPNKTRIRGLDDVGGWFQFKESWDSRLESNAAFGLDNAFSGQLRTQNVTSESEPYQQLARNRTFLLNTIYSPSAYLSFSVEYRKLLSSPISGKTAVTDVPGIGAGFRF